MDKFIGNALQFTYNSRGLKGREAVVLLMGCGRNQELTMYPVADRFVGSNEVKLEETEITENVLSKPKTDPVPYLSRGNLTWEGIPITKQKKVQYYIKGTFLYSLDPHKRFSV